MNAETITILVGPEDAGRRLDTVVGAAPRVGSRAAAQKMIADGLVSVDGISRPKNYRTDPGDLITVEMPPPLAATLEPENLELRIPFEDEHLLVVDKPAGMVTHPARGHATGTLVHGLLGHQIGGGGSAHRPGIVHRLDRDTSGLLIVAKDDATHRLLTEMMKNRQIKRTYLALVHGVPGTGEGTIEAALDRDHGDRKKMAIAGAGRGRDAVTHFRVLRTWTAAGAAATGSAKGGHKSKREGFSLLEVSLETGRTHQIRVHLSAIGHPVAGDRSYGPRREALGLGRQFLHARLLEFEHPLSGERIEVESPLPEDLQRALDRLG